MATAATAKQHQYRLWADADPGTLLVDVTVKGTSYRLTVAQALGPGLYHWQVRAIDGAGNASPWSIVWDFTLP